VPVLGDTLFSETLASGLRALYLYRPGWAKTYATIAAHYGSLDSAWRAQGQEVFVPDGIAHFLEHKLFEQEDGSVMDRFSALGASSNAYTSYHATTYLFSATDHVEEALALLVSFVQRGHFTPASVAKERGIIEQEVSMYRDDPGWRAWHNLLQGLYHRHPVRTDIAGTPASLREITDELLRLCHRTFYRPGNMLFFAVGPLPPEQVFSVVRAQLPEEEERWHVERIRPVEPPEVVHHEVEERMAVGLPLLQLGFKVPSGCLSLREELAASLMLDALLGRASPLYAELYEAGLITERFHAQVFKGEDFAAVVVGGESPDPKRLAGRLQEGFAAARAQGLPAKTVARAQKAAIGEFIALFNSPESLAHVFHDLYFKGEDFLEVLPTLKTVSQEDVAAALSLLDPQYATASYVLPLVG
jgi:predicted Zn-dependent peptidase